MSSLDILSMAMRNLFKRKLRTALTVLGVVIGTTAIVVMISLGIGINMSFEKQMAGMTNLTTIELYHNAGENGMIMMDKEYDAILQLEGVLTATPIIEMNYSLAAVSGKYRADWISITGIRPEAMELMDIPLTSGRTLEKDGKSMEIVFGTYALEQFLSDRQRVERERAWRSNRGRGYFVEPAGGGAGEKTYNIDPLNDKIQMSFVSGFGQKDAGQSQQETDPDAPIEGGKSFKPYDIVGVGVMGGETYDYTYVNYMSIDDVRRINDEAAKYYKAMGYGSNSEKFEETGYRRGIVKAKDTTYVEGLITKLEEMGFSYVWSQMSYIIPLKKTAASLQGLLGAIGAVSLFVAAIGIANTMIMSIYERTKEIGVMKVIGAALRDIRNLFLVEAALIGLIGGIVGLGLSIGVSYVLNNVKGLDFVQMFAAYGEEATVSFIPAWLCGTALVFSCVVGLISGYFPARRAMKLSALSAIRAE